MSSYYMYNGSFEIPLQIEPPYNLESLPDDIISIIFAHLNGCDIARIECTCRRWNLISTRSSSNLWQNVYKDQFALPLTVPKTSNTHWRLLFRHHWWKRSWVEIAQTRDRRRSLPLSPTHSNLSFLRLIGLCGLLTFLFGNVVMNLWNSQILLGWHSLALLYLLCLIITVCY